MTEKTASVSADVLRDIQGITFFLDGKGGGHAEDGNALLAIQHPELALRRGEVDAFIVYPHEDAERWNAGWIGGGQFIGTWLESESGLIVDPWIDERLRSAPNAETSNMEPLPIIYRSRGNDDVLGYLHQKGEPIVPTQEQKQLHAEYTEWMTSGEMEKSVPTRSRTLLTDDGMTAIAPHSRWAQAVISADQRGIPPTRARNQVRQREAAAPQVPKDERTIEERIAEITGRPPETEAAKRQRENREFAMETVTTMATKQPLSWRKTAFAIALGVAIGWLVVTLVG